MIDLSEAIRTEGKSLKNECKGLVFRGYASSFYDIKRGRVEWREGIRLLKKKSCPGCEECGGMLDSLPDMIYCQGVISPEGGIEDGKLYTMTVTNISKDCESGIVDDWDLQIIQVEK
jgi:hypothetical protein